MRITKRLTGALARAAVVASLVGASLLGVAGRASAAAFNGTPGYFPGNGTPANDYDIGGTALAPNAGGTLAYSSSVYPGSGNTQSFDLNGSTTLADADTSVGNLGSGDFALGFHFQTSQPPPAQIQLLTKQVDCSGQGVWFQIDLAVDGSIYVQFFGGTSNPILVAGANLIDGAWHDVQLVRSGDTLYLLVDRVLGASAAFTGPNPTNTAPLRVGGGPCVTGTAGSAARIQNFMGQMSNIYLGPGALYTLSVDNSNTTVPPGTSGGPTLSYLNAEAPGGVMHTEVTAPTGTTLSSLSGPGCTTATASCQWPLEGHGAPITADVAVPSSAPLNTTFSGGNFSQTDRALPLSPSSTNWDPSNGSANVAFSVNTNTVPTPLVDWNVAGGAGGALVLVGAGYVLYRRRRAAAPRAAEA